MSNAYEKDIGGNLNSRRNLVLLGVRADADIDYRDQKIAKLTAERDKLLTLISDVVEDADEFETEWNKLARAAMEGGK